MWTATTHLHHCLLEKGLDQTMVKPDVVEADKEMVVGDVHLDHDQKPTMIAITEHQKGKDLNLVTIIRKRRQESVKGESPTMETKDL